MSALYFLLSLAGVAFLALSLFGAICSLVGLIDELRKILFGAREQ
jgi:hypothetical protein